MDEQTWRLEDITMYETTGTATKTGTYQLKLLEGITLEQPFGQIVGVIGDKDSGMEALSAVLRRKQTPSKGTLAGYDGPIVNIDLEAVTRSDQTGEAYAQQFYQSQGYSKKKATKLLKRCEAYSELGQRYHQKISHYTMEERAQLELSIKLQGTAQVIMIDGCLAFLKTRFLLKVLARLEELKLMGGSIWLFSPYMEKLIPYCDQLLWLEFGRLREFGHCDTVVASYQNYLVALQRMSIEEQQAFIEEGLTSQMERKLDELATIPTSRRSRRSESVTRAVVKEKRHRHQSGSRWLQIVVGLGAAGVIGTSFFFLGGLLTEEKIGQGKPSKAPVVLTSPIQSDTKESESSQQTTATSAARLPETAVPQEPEVPPDTKIAKASFDHTIKSGETLEEIASTYNISIADLMAVNQLKEDGIFAGAKLWLPANAVKREEPQKQAETNNHAPTNTEAVPVAEPVATKTYTVESGDTLYRLASRYGVDVMTIQRENHLQTPDLYPGQVLTIP